MNILREPAQVGKLRYARTRVQAVRRWGITSFVGTAALAVSFWKISLHRTTDLGSMLGGVVGMLIVAGLVEGGKLLQARYLLTSWQWDAERLCVGRACYRWQIFQYFHVQPDTLAPGFMRLSVQCRPGRWHQGTRVSIVSYKEEIEAWAQVALQYIPQRTDHPGEV